MVWSGKESDKKMRIRFCTHIFLHIRFGFVTRLAVMSFQSIRCYVDKTWVKTNVQSILALCSWGLLDALQGFQFEQIFANTRQFEANIPQRRCEMSFVTIFNQVFSTSPQNAINLIDVVKLLAEMCDGDASVSVDVRALSGEQIIQVHRSGTEWWLVGLWSAVYNWSRL